MISSSTSRCCKPLNNCFIESREFVCIVFSNSKIAASIKLNHLLCNFYFFILCSVMIFYVFATCIHFRQFGLLFSSTVHSTTRHREEVVSTTINTKVNTGQTKQWEDKELLEKASSLCCSEPAFSWPAAILLTCSLQRPITFTWNVVLFFDILP